MAASVALRPVATLVEQNNAGLGETNWQTAIELTGRKATSSRYRANGAYVGLGNDAQHCFE